MTKKELLQLKEMAAKIDVVYAEGADSTEILEQFFLAVEAVPPEVEAEILSADVVEYYNMMVEKEKAEKAAAEKKAQEAQEAAEKSLEEGSTVREARVESEKVEASKEPAPPKPTPAPKPEKAEKPAPAPKVEKKPIYKTVLLAVMQNPAVTTDQLKAVLKDAGIDEDAYRISSLQTQIGDFKRMRSVLVEADLLKL